MTDPDGTKPALARLCQHIGRLKRVPRTGWIDRGVPANEVESVAEHSFRTAAIAWLAAANESDLDRDRVLKLALIHDLAEALTGDTTPYDRSKLQHLSDSERFDALNRRHVRSGKDQVSKSASEDRAMADLTSALDPGIAEELMELWEEVRDRKTPESRFVKQVDILETWLQSREYAEHHPDLPMASFELEAEEEITHERLQAIRSALLQER